MGCQPQSSEELNPPAFSTTASMVVADLKEKYPETPFLALGQTALWDEPTKAALRVALDTLWPEARLIAAAHDTDYFAKLPGHGKTPESKFALVLHDDAKTRGLWSAAGEMSQLFGSEDVPTRQLLEKRGGVSLYRALQYTDAPGFVLSELTAAWGWTGIIYTEWDRKIARDIALTEILPTLLEQIDSAIQSSAECIEGERSWEVLRVGTRIRDWVMTFAQADPGGSLTDLYEYLLPRFYELLMGRPATNLSTSNTMELLRFNTQTASLPRFAFVDLFLNPITRKKAIESYNLAVAGSDTYTLDQFGEGALPFDLVIPGRGRGTIRIPGDGTILVDTPREPIVLCDRRCDFASIESLAQLVERELGPDVALVGKAVTLLPMVCAEHILVFHESASGYSGRTQQMLTLMQERKLPVPTVHPILRIRYNTWDSLSAVAPDQVGMFLLPEFLAQALGRDQIDYPDFAYCWRNAIAWEERRLTDLAGIHSPRALLLYLCRQKPEKWKVLSEQYEVAAEQLAGIRRQAEAIQTEEHRLREQVRQWKAEVVALEREKGADFHKRIFGKFPDVELLTAICAERQERFDGPIARLLQQVRETQLQVHQLSRERRALERGPEAMAVRATMGKIAADAEREKARQARNALQTIYGLPHIDYRPSAWWFPVVDPSGAWFARLAATAEYYLEPLKADA